MRRYTLVRHSVRAALLTALALLLAAGATSAAPAAATTTDHYVARGGDAFASWSYDVPGNCGHTNLLVLALSSVTVTAGPSDGLSALVVIYDTTDTCHGTPFNGSVFTTIPTGSLQVTGPNPYLNATLGPVPVTLASETGGTVKLVVNLNWTSTTAPTRLHRFESFAGGGMRMQDIYLAQTVDVPAAGSVMLGSTNLTPLPSDSGNINTDLYGSLTVTHQ